MKRWIIAVALILAAMVLAGGVGTLATPKTAQQEKLECTVCHEKEGSKNLTDKGKYYETLRTLDGYDRLTAQFGNCLHCHKNKPGSKKLTKEGERVRKVVKDMKGLYQWLKEGHTGSPGE